MICGAYIALRDLTYGLLPEIRIDTSKATVVPTITISDADTSPKIPEAPSAVSGPPSLPGDLPTTPAQVIPDWYKVGWRQVGGIDAPVSVGDAKDKSILDAFLSEQFYGDWYHSAALIIFVSLKFDYEVVLQMADLPHRLSLLRTS